MSLRRLKTGPFKRVLKAPSQVTSRNVSNSALEGGGGDHIPCFELPSHSFWGVKDILLPRGMLAGVLRALQEATFLGLE